MGCVLSSQDIADLQSNVFMVQNIDEKGQGHNLGKIEVAQDELVYYQKGKCPVKWPLKCLRRYGFDAELFSFECGRRCATGPGIYAFKCRRAEMLFNLLQESIIRAGQAEGQRMVSNETNVIETQLEDGRRQSGVSNGLHSYINLTSNSHDYINSNSVIAPTAGASGQQCRPSVSHSVSSVDSKSANGKCSSDSEVQAPLEENDDVFVTVSEPEVQSGEQLRPIRFNRSPSKTLPVPGSKLERKQVDQTHSYANLSGNSDSSRSLKPPKPEPQLTYIQLNVQASEENVKSRTRLSTTSISSSRSCSPSAPSKTYATIDFDKTLALNDRTTNRQDDGERKTRHNSNIDSIERVS